MSLTAKYESFSLINCDTFPHHLPFRKEVCGRVNLSWNHFDELNSIVEALLEYEKVKATLDQGPVTPCVMAYARSFASVHTRMDVLLEHTKNNTKKINYQLVLTTKIEKKSFWQKLLCIFNPKSDDSMDYFHKSLNDAYAETKEIFVRDLNIKQK